MEAVNFGPGLTGYRHGLDAIEAAYTAGLKLVRTGSEVDIQAAGADIDRAAVGQVLELLRGRRESIIGITADPQRTRQALAEAQLTLAAANEWVLDQLDLWDRLEKIYRSMFPDDTMCVRGEEGCLPEAVVTCKACGERRVWYG